MATQARSNHRVQIELKCRLRCSARRLKDWSTKLVITLVGLTVMSIFLMPLLYMVATAFKHDSQLALQHAPWYPAEAATYNYQGKDLPLYNVPTGDGMKQ